MSNLYGIRSLFFVVSTILPFGSHPMTAAEKTTVALTTTVSSAGTTIDRTIAASLISLVELGVLKNDSMQVVERQQLDVLLQELALNRSRTAEETLQLGKLVSADILVMLEVRKSNSIAKSTAVLRVVEAKTAAIRGVTAVDEVDESNLEEAADQFSRFIQAIQDCPSLSTVTVAVVPFESIGRFDRLRPLELGLRDLITAQLLRRTRELDPATNGKGGKPGAVDEERQHPFQVLQRSSMEQLLREMELVHSGFTNNNPQPENLPERQAAYLVKGDIDERQIDGAFKVIVRAQLLQAFTATTIDTFELECLPSELEAALTLRVDQFATRLGLAAGSESPIDDRGMRPEAQSLKTAAIEDLHRFRRICPIDYTHRVFSVPGEKWIRNVPKLAKPETALGKSLLRKSIDRFESVLFLYPDDVLTAYALGFCFTFHEPDIYQPARAEKLFRRVYDSQPGSQLGAYALTLLAEIAFHDRTGQLDPKERDATAERIWFAFEHIPETYRDLQWPRMLELFAATNRTAQQNVALLKQVSSFVEQAGETYRKQLAGETKAIAQRLAAQTKNDSELRNSATELMKRWAATADKTLADTGRQGLAFIYTIDKDYLSAAQQYETSAKAIANQTSPTDRNNHDMQLIHAAKNYRMGKKTEVGLKLLRSFEPANPRTGTLILGYHGYEIGACLEELGEKDEAAMVYQKTIDVCPSIVPNSDITQRLKALGGYSLRPDRDIDVRYIKVDGKLPATNACLAVLDKQLFVGGAGLWKFDIETEKWTSFKINIGKITCLKIRDEIVWAGTNGNGLWRCDLKADEWTKIGTEQGLPDLHITSLALFEDNIYAGVGSNASGGLIRIDSSGTVHVLDGVDSPSVAPTHLIIEPERILARTLLAVHEHSMKTGTWTVHKMKSGDLMAPHLFAGSKVVWASAYGRELTIWGADEKTNQIFKAAWYSVPNTKAGYLVYFVAEREDEVWFGGRPWDHTSSAGLYRIHKKTGKFDKFSPRDGFMAENDHAIYDGLWLDGKLWLTTHLGLCAVSHRNELYTIQPKGSPANNP